MGFPESWVFDLDGTLVQTETLKADSYHAALVRVEPGLLIGDVQAHYATVVGQTGEAVARSMVERFTTVDRIQAALPPQPREEAWATLYRVRKAAYAELLEDPEALRRVACPHNRVLLETLREEGARTALATMSHRPQVARVLDVLGLQGAFETVATRDDVVQGKPDPEIYHLVFGRLGTAPQHSVIVEDSPSGAAAAVASGAHVLVVVNDVTREAIRGAGLDVPVFESDPTLLDGVRAWRAATSAR